MLAAATAGVTRNRPFLKAATMRSDDERSDGREPPEGRQGDFAKAARLDLIECPYWAKGLAYFYEQLWFNR